MTSPYFGSSQKYYHNLNCTWMLKAEQGSYINFEIDFFEVKNNTYCENDFNDFSKR